MLATYEKAANKLASFDVATFSRSRLLLGGLILDEMLAFSSSQTPIAHSWLQEGGYVKPAKTLAEVQQGAAATRGEAERERDVERVVKRALKNGR